MNVCYICSILKDDYCFHAPPPSADFNTRTGQPTFLPDCSTVFHFPRLRDVATSPILLSTILGYSYTNFVAQLFFAYFPRTAENKWL